MNYYSEVILGGGSLWQPDIDCLTGILMNYCDQFYLNGGNGQTINGFTIGNFKWQVMYKDLLTGSK